MNAKIMVRKVEGEDLRVQEREVDIARAFGMLDELEDRFAAPLHEMLRWLCDKEFPIPVELAVSFKAGDNLVIVEHLTDSEDVNDVMVMVESSVRPEAVEIRFPSEAVKAT